MVRNEIVLPMKLASKEAGGPASGHPEGMRAVSVRVNEVIGVAGYVLPGTRVDILATASPTTRAPT
jgi:pilus assembly protein CpaB